jgi:hypothetical protein
MAEKAAYDYTKEYLKYKFMSKINSKLLVLITLITGGFITLPSTVIAVTLEPNSGNYSPGSILNINLKATPETGENAVALRLEASGMIIKGYTPPSGWLIANADCEDGTYYTEANICVSLAKIEDIVAGESLGVISAQLVDSEKATITGLEENTYSDGITERKVVGILGTYSNEINGNSNASKDDTVIPEEIVEDNATTEPTSYVVDNEQNEPSDVNEESSPISPDSGTNSVVIIGIVICSILLMVNFYILYRKVKKMKAEKLALENSESSTATV